MKSHHSFQIHVSLWISVLPTFHDAFLFIHFPCPCGTPLCRYFPAPFTWILQIVTIAGLPHLAVFQSLRIGADIQKSALSQFFYYSPDAACGTFTVRGDGVDFHFARVSAAGAEFQIAIHRKFLGRQVAAKNCAVQLKFSPAIIKP